MKYLFCKKCNTYPKTIKEIYDAGITEIRQWNGETYELIESNICETPYKSVCGVCGSVLIEK